MVGRVSVDNCGKMSIFARNTQLSALPKDAPRFFHLPNSLKAIGFIMILKRAQRKSTCACMAFLKNIPFKEFS
ncbi:hypothetical protein NHP22001_05530 [Helicobacter sp. NHP22-001]|nr:hypothetical protein NHP22001_05530 [Helicobacter sp. NHP22-001]